MDRPLESLRNGHPRFSALISANPSFHIYRRFSQLRARLLLRLQDRLSVLEDRLNQLDSQETSPLFLACQRMDANTERQAVLDEIAEVMERYDTLVERTHRTLDFGDASKRDVDSLRNWLAGNVALSRDSASYLLARDDLFCVVSSQDPVTKIEAMVEDGFICCLSGLYRRSCNKVSRDPHVYLPSGQKIQLLARVTIAVVIIAALLGPVLMCVWIQRSAGRICVVAVATAVFVVVLSVMANIRTIEIVVAGTTYATVLTVFFSNAAPVG